VDLDCDRTEFAQAIEAATIFADLEAALVKVVALTPTSSDPENYGRKLFIPSLDRVIPHLSEALKLDGKPAAAKSNARVCIVATEFYGVGGHTRVALDLIAGLGPDHRPMIALTNVASGSLQYRALLQDRSVLTNLPADGMVVLSSRSLIERIQELHQVLKAARPTRILLFCHPYDIIAIAAVWRFRDIVEFVHHVDHVPALGASLPWSAHVDLTYACHQACRSAGLDAVFASMTSPVIKARPHVRDPGRLRFATCGHHLKYSGVSRHRWTDYAVAALREPGAEFIHIGDVPEALQTEIRQALAAGKIDPARYVFAGPKSSLPAALIEAGTDIYLSSYPTNGSKANLEAMLAGIPVIAPSDPDGLPLLRFALPLQSYVDVQSPEAFGRAVEEALALGEAMGGADQVAALSVEIARFSDFVAGRPLSPA
jgi:glycosyltransferase involved in cell wall biosynthesis